MLIPTQQARKFQRGIVIIFYIIIIIYRLFQSLYDRQTMKAFPVFPNFPPGSYTPPVALSLVQGSPILAVHGPGMGKGITSGSDCS